MWEMLQNWLGINEAELETKMIEIDARDSYRSPVLEGEKGVDDKPHTARPGEMAATLHQTDARGGHFPKLRAITFFALYCK